MGSLNYPNKVKDVYRKLVYTNDGTNLLHDGANDTALSTITANITGQASDLTNHFTGLSITSLAANDFLKWDGSKWLNAPIGSTVSMSELQDSNITEPANNAILKYDSSSSKWVDSDALGAGLQVALSYNAPSENTSNPSTSAQILTALNLKLNVADIDDTAVDGETAQPISSNWAFDHNAGTGNSKHVPAAGSAGQFLKHDGTWGTPPGSATNLGQNTASSTLEITSSSGSNVTIAEATGSIAGVMSTAHHDKLDGIEASADVTDATNVTAAGALMDSELTDLAGVKGVTISTLQVKPSEGAFADGDKTKLDAIAAGAEVNVQSDWNASSGDAQILNKPTVQYTSAIPDATASQTGLATSTQITKLDGIAANANNYTHTTNANLTGHVTSTGNAAVLGSFTVAQLSTALSDASISGNNTGDQTKADFDVDHVIALIGAAADTSENLGTFTGSTIADNQTVKASIQALETALELKAPLASPTFTGTVYIGTSDGLRVGGNIRVDQVTAAINASGTHDIDFDDHAIVRATFSAGTAYASTIELQEPSGSGWKTLILTQYADTNAQTLTYTTSGSSNLLWPGGTAPTLSSGSSEIDILSFYYDPAANSGNGSWYGNYGINYS